MRKLSRVWVVYRSYSGDTGAWQHREQEVISEHSTKQEAEEAARRLDWGKDMGSPTWHYVREMTKNVTYY